MKTMHFIAFSALILFCITGYAQSNTFPSSGSVGIGTTGTNNGKLTIKGSNVDGNLLRLENDSSGQEATMRFRSIFSGGATLHADISLYGQGGYMGFKIPHDNDAGAGYRMVITNDGKVGVGQRLRQIHYMLTMAD